MLAHRGTDRSGVALRDSASCVPGVEWSMNLEIPAENHGSFGLALEPKIPKGSDMIVVCGWNSPGGWVPLRILLPHQLYVEDIKKILKKWEEVWIIPYRSGREQLVARRMSTATGAASSESGSATPSQPDDSSEGAKTE